MCPLTCLLLSLLQHSFSTGIVIGQNTQQPPQHMCDSLQGNSAEIDRTSRSIKLGLPSPHRAYERFWGEPSLLWWPSAPIRWYSGCNAHPNPRRAVLTLRVHRARPVHAEKGRLSVPTTRLLGGLSGRGCFRRHRQGLIENVTLTNKLKVVKHSLNKDSENKAHISRSKCYQNTYWFPNYP